MKYVLFAIAGLWLVTTLLLIGATWYANRYLKRGLTIGDAAPAFALHDQDGRPHRLEDYRRRPLALVFLPDLGSTSVQQLRAVNAKITQFDTLGLKVFAAAPVDAATAKRVHDGERLNFPVLLDRDRAVAQDYDGHTSEGAGRRSSYVVGGDGRVLLPITIVHTADHGQQLVELTECCLDTKPRTPSHLIGKPVADFRLPRVSDGRPESLYGDRARGVTVLFVLSAECPCSGRYDARITELAARYAPRGLRFVAMNSSANETTAEIAAYARKAGYPFPVLKDMCNVVADRLEAHVTPEAFVFDAHGVLRYHGRIDDNRDPALVRSHDLRNVLDLLLAGRLPARADLPTFGCAIYRGGK